METAHPTLQQQVSLHKRTHGAPLGEDSSSNNSNAVLRSLMGKVFCDAQYFSAFKKYLRRRHDNTFEMVYAFNVLKEIGLFCSLFSFVFS